MLTFNQKVSLFNDLTDIEEVSYADTFQAEIQLIAQNHDYTFLNSLHSEQEMKMWIQKIKSRIVMNEDRAEVNEIIEDYIEFG